MKYEDILPIAEKYRNILAPYCERIQIAGSIRRKKLECRDIELVMIRHPELLEELKELVGEWKRIRGSITGRYTQVEVPEGLKIDIFIAVDDGSNWGNIYLIRTGNWVFSRFMMGIRPPQLGMTHREGYLWIDYERLYCYEEEEVFKLLEMKYIPPEEREWE